MRNSKAMSKHPRTTHKNHPAIRRLISQPAYHGPKCRTKYEYDKLGQVTSGKRYWADGTVVAGQQFDYAFDDIGNRSSTKVGGDANGLNQRSATYSANNLNQYTSRTVPAQVSVSGIALPASTMTVNSQATSRKGEYYWGEATANNASAADFLSITSLATFGSTNNSTNGYVFVPKTPETFSYDADGNLTNDGRWVYTWDGENRLTQLESQTTAPAASKRKITHTYDYQSRLIARKSYTNNGSYQIKSDTKYLNDGWRCLAEINATNNNLIRGYVWGLDLSGSFEGAGGIGGLLMLTDAATSTSHFYAYDGNGNVSAMAKTSDSSKTAHYEYGPFGEVVRASGTIAKSNPMRFSTKCQDDESDLLYYGYRFYNASTGRWLSRDPIEEFGGINPYVTLENELLSQIDLLGLLLFGDEKIRVGKRTADGKKLHYTQITQLAAVGDHEIEETKEPGCPEMHCAQIKKAKELRLKWKTRLADPFLAIGLSVTVNGYDATLVHERKRQGVINSAYSEFLADAELTGSAALACGKLCCSKRGQAKRALVTWLDNLQTTRLKSAGDYETQEEVEIEKENLRWRRVGGLIDSLENPYVVKPPVGPGVALCPTCP